MEQMKLLIEDACELQTEVLDELNESTGEKTKNYYIHGTFSTPDKKNRNGRVYSTKLWENAIAGWREKVKVDNKYRLGEMEHPSRVDPDPMKAVIKITSLKLENGLVTGRAKILNDNSPTTNKMKALIDEGIKIGVSSRGTGRMKGSIVEEFNLSTYDVVQSPSDYNAMLSGIVESTEEYVYMNESTGKWICDSKGCSLEESAKVEETKCSKAAKSLQEVFNQFAAEPEVITETEKLARALLKLDENKNAPLADKLLASFKDTKEQQAFERKNGSVYKMSKEELLKFLGESNDFKKAKDEFWAGANAMKKAMNDEKMAKQLESALSDVSEVISAYYDSIK